MNLITLLIQSAAVLGALGLAVGLILVIASKKFRVETNPLIDDILTVLPNANCGACGYAGCADFASRVVNEGAPLNGCPVGGFDVAKQIGGIMGQDISKGEQQYPIVLCNGGTNCVNRFDYIGIEDCKAVMMLSDGEKGCNYGCMGRGTCVRACPFNAISIGADRLPHVNKNICTSCGLCISSCPNKILIFGKESDKVHVRCHSPESGKKVKEVCSVGCIGCKICEKACPENAITVTNFLAMIDQDKCTSCALCVQKCPQHTIEFGDIL